MTMTGKRVLVTGATNGIGEVTALELARQGAEVIIVSRNPQRCQETVKRITAQTNNPHVSFMAADLSSMAQVRRVADEFRAKYQTLDVLVNNAGAIFDTRQVSVDGYEMTFALNHLSYFLLTHLLLDTLKTTAQQTGEARIVNVASDAHRGARISFDDLQREKRYAFFPVYGETKLMNIMFSYELAKRLAGTQVVVNALHPGFVRTGFGQNNNVFMKTFIRLAGTFIGISPEQGAETMIYLASSPEVKGVSGKYFDKKREVKSDTPSYDEAAWVRLWQLSEQAVGLKPVIV